MFFFQQDSSDLNTFQFVDMSIGEVRSWLWQFGDGQVSTEQNPLHHYDREGVYVVTLTIRADYCTSTVEMIVFTADDITYDNSCRALFLPFIEPDSNAVFFLNLSTPNATHFWEFGDGQTSDQINPVHQYAEGGTFEIKLTITTEDGCTSTFTVSLDLEQNNFQASPEFFSVTATRNLDQLETLRLFPNPASENLRLQIKAKEEMDLQLQILDVTGQLMQQQKVEIQLGENQFKLDVDQLPPGMYFLRLWSQDGSKTLRFVKQRL